MPRRRTDRRPCSSCTSRAGAATRRRRSISRVGRRATSCGPSLQAGRGSRRRRSYTSCRRSSRRSEMEFTTLAEGLDHPEGAAIGPDGTVYAGGEAGQIYRIAPDGTPEQYADTGGFLYGVTVDGGGNVYGCDMGRGEIVRVDPNGGVTSYSRGTDEHPLRVPNFS